MTRSSRRAGKPHPDLGQLERLSLDTGSPADLVLVAHGTRDKAGRATSLAIRAAVAARLPGVDVDIAYIDVQAPHVGDVVTRHARTGRRVAVVPLLLSLGYHVEVDVRGAVAPHPNAAASGPLGPHPILADILADRLWEAGAQPGDAVVLAAAGSSRASSARDTEAVASLLARRWPGRVGVGYGAAATPRVEHAVAAARAWRSCTTGRVVVASYLIGEGYFLSRLAGSGTDLLTDPMATHPGLVELIALRYVQACAALDALEREAV